MFRFFNILIKQGVGHVKGDALREKKVILTNSIAFLLGITTLPFIGVFYILGGKEYGYLTLLINLVFFSSIYLNKIGKTDLSRHILLFTWGGGVFVYALLLGIDTSLQNCFFSLMAVPFIMYSPNEIKSKSFHVIFGCIAYVILEFELIDFSNEKLISFEVASRISSFVNPTVLLQIILLVYYYGAHERSLLQEIKKSKHLNMNLKKSEEDLNFLLNSMDDVVLEVNAFGEIINFWAQENGTIEVGESVKDYFGSFMFIKIGAAFYSFKNDYFSKVYEYSYDSKFYQFKISPIKRIDVSEVTAVVSIRDITDFKELSVEYESVKNQKELAEASAEFKESFLANMSHEIRTPLNGVVGMIDLLQDSNLDNVQLDYVKTLKSSSDNLLTLINDILDVSKIQAGKLSIIAKPNNFHLLIKNVIALFNSMAVNKGLVLNSEIGDDVPEYLVFDSTRLNQVLTNLISNAIKFTLEGSITLKITKNQRGFLFEVIDTGEGIPEESYKLLFQKFTQIGNSHNTTIKGTGLGLTIVSELVTLMGGEINLKSKLGKGTTFYFTLPLEVCKVDVQERSNIIEKKKEGFVFKRILLVDDIDVNRKIASLMLKNSCEEIIEASNGVEAINSVQMENFDIILMDIQMPVMDGVEAMRKIKSMGIQTPIVALSANALEGDKERYLNNGFNGYISKPITMIKLQEGMHEFVKN